jgi:glutamate--cysteine ligase catalytic subunit
MVTFGAKPDTPGLVCLVKDYLETLDIDSESRRRIDEYLDFVKARANGLFDSLSTSHQPT